MNPNKRLISLLLSMILMLGFTVPILAQSHVSISEQTGTIDGAISVAYTCPVITFASDKAFEGQMNQIMQDLVCSKPTETTDEESVESGGGSEVRSYEVTANNEKYLAFKLSYAFRPTLATSVYLNTKSVIFDLVNKKQVAFFDVFVDTKECNDYIINQVNNLLNISGYVENGSGIDYDKVILTDDGIIITYGTYQIDAMPHELRIIMPKEFYKNTIINSPSQEIQVFVDGVKIAFDQPPIIEDDRTLVPMRAIFEAMGATVEWDDNTQTAKATKGTTTMLVQIDNKVMKKNGMEILLDVSPKVINNRMLVPVRAVAESFGATVSWDDTIKAVMILTDNRTDLDILNNVKNDEELNFILNKVNNSFLYASIMSIPDFTNINELSTDDLIGMAACFGGKSKAEVDQSLLKYFNYMGFNHQSTDKWTLKGDNYETTQVFGVESEIVYRIADAKLVDNTLQITIESLTFEDFDGTLEEKYKDFESKYNAWVNKSDGRIYDFGKCNLVFGIRDNSTIGKYYITQKKLVE